VKRFLLFRGFLPSCSRYPYAWPKYCCHLFLSGPLTILGNFVYKLANRLHLIPTSSGGDIENSGYNQIPLSARAEAERRR